jgi:hypothetical protein
MTASPDGAARSASIRGGRTPPEHRSALCSGRSATRGDWQPPAAQSPAENSRPTHAVLGAGAAQEREDGRVRADGRPRHRGRRRRVSPARTFLHPVIKPLTSRIMLVWTGVPSPCPIGRRGGGVSTTHRSWQSRGRRRRSGARRRTAVSGASRGVGDHRRPGQPRARDTARARTGTPGRTQPRGRAAGRPRRRGPTGRGRAGHRPATSRTRAVGDESRQRGRADSAMAGGEPMVEAWPRHPHVLLRVKSQRPLAYGFDRPWFVATVNLAMH